VESEAVEGCVAEDDHPQRHGSGQRQPPPAQAQVIASARGTQQRDQRPRAQQGQRRVDRQEVAHGRHPAPAQPAKYDQHPHHRNRVARPSPARPHNGQARPGPRSPGQQPQRNAKPPQDNVAPRIEIGDAAGPLVIGRAVPLAGSQVRGLGDVLAPAGVELQPEDARPQESVRLQQPEDDQRQQRRRQHAGQGRADQPRPLRAVQRRVQRRQCPQHRRHHDDPGQRRDIDATGDGSAQRHPKERIVGEFGRVPDEQQRRRQRDEQRRPRRQSADQHTGYQRDPQQAHRHANGRRAPPRRGFAPRPPPDSTRRHVDRQHHQRVDQAGRSQSQHVARQG